MGSHTDSNVNHYKLNPCERESGGAGLQLAEGADQLAQQNKFLLNILASLDHPFYVIDANDYTVKLANSTAKIRDPRERLTCYSLTHGRDVPCSDECVCPLEEVKRTKKPTVVSHVHIDEQGNARYVEVHADPVLDSNGLVAQVVEYTQDITERKQAEEALQQSEQRFREILEHSPDVLYKRNLRTGQYQYVSPAVTRITGYSPQEVMAMSPAEIEARIHPEDRETLAQLAEQWMSKCLEGPLSGAAEYRVECKDGVYRWIADSFTLFPGPDGHPLFSVASIRDITERRRAQEELRKSEEKFRQIAETVREVFWAGAPDWSEVRYVSPAYAEVWGRSCQSLYDEPFSWLDGVHEDDRECIVAAIESKASGALDDPGFPEYRVVRPDGSVRWISARAYPIRNESGRVVGIAGIAEDITERKRAENLIRIERDLAVKLGSMAELKKALPVCFEAAMKASGMDCGGIYLLDSASGALELAFHERLSPDFVGSVLRFGADSANMQLVKRGEPVYTEHKTLGVPLDENERCEGLRAIAIVPMLHNGEVIGCLNAASHSLDVVPAWSRAALETVTAQIASLVGRLKAEQALRQSEEQYRTLFENMAQGAFCRRSDGSLVRVNQAALNMFGLTGEQFREKDSHDPGWRVIRDDGSALPPDEHPSIMALRTGNPVRNMIAGVFNPVKEDYVWMNINAIPRFRLGEENPYEVFVTMHDVTERRRAEEALRENRQFLQNVFDAIRDGISVLDTSLNIIRTNRWIEQMYAHQMPLTDRKCYQAYQQRQSPCPWCPSLRTLETGQTHTEIVPYPSADDPEGWIELTSFPVKDEHGRVTNIIEYVKDITERQRAEGALLQYQAQLKSLASELTLTEERLRRSIATDLHDLISQSLAMSKAKVGALSESVSDEQLKSALVEISDSLGETLDESRSLTSRLSYPTLTLLGLGKAVAKWLTEEVQAKHGIKTEFEDDEQSGSLDEDVRAVLFRGVRELLTNVVKHAGANKVLVSIRREADQVHVCVQDDGRGFCPPEPGEARGGYGMLSVREALERLGGRLEIESEPGCGCKATMTAPSGAEMQTE